MRRLGIAGAALLAASCGYHAPAAPSSTIPPPTHGTPWTLSVSGAGLTGGTSARIFARAADAYGDGTAHVTVHFTTTSGVLSEPDPQTNETGIAETTLTAAPSTSATVTAVLDALAVQTVVVIQPDGAPTFTPGPPILAPPVPTPTPPAVVPSFSVGLVAAPTTVAAGSGSLLTATAVPINGAPAATSYAWDCDGDGTAEVTNALTTHSCTYSTVGSVTSRVTVAGGSVTGAGSTTVTVVGPALTLTCTPLAGKIVNCAVTATLNGAPVVSTGISVGAWDFGDAGAGAHSAAGNTATNTYTAVNTYTVRALSVTVTGSTAAANVSANITAIN